MFPSEYKSSVAPPLHAKLSPCSSSTAIKMFAKKTRSILKCLGAEKDLIYHDNLNEKVELLTLVKITKLQLKYTIKYTFMDLTLLDLLKEPEEPAGLVSKGISVLENVTSSTKRTTDNSVGGLADASVSGKTTTEDSATSFTVKKDEVNLRDLRALLSAQTMKESFNKIVTKQKTEKLAFVYQVFYNSSTVTLHSKAHGKGSIKSLAIKAKSSNKEETRFTVPKDSTFAFRLMEINTDGGKIEIPLRTRAVRRIYKNGPQHFAPRFPAMSWVHQVSADLIVPCSVDRSGSEDDPNRPEHRTAGMKVLQLGGGDSLCSMLASDLYFLFVTAMRSVNI
ncbi:uncharacterized protein FYW61_015918 [Anableps anableps]